MALTTNEMTNFDELTIDKYVEGSYKAKRVLMTLAYIFVPLAFIVFLFAIGLGAIGLIIFIPLFYCWAFGKFVVPLTWRYVNISYTYIVKAGKFTMLTVYNSKGSKKVKNTFTPVTIDDMTAIAPFSDKFADALAPERSTIFIPAVHISTIPITISLLGSTRTARPAHVFSRLQTALSR